MDSIDLKVLNQLMVNGRVTWSELASQVNLSSPAVSERVNRLVSQGVIKKIGAVIDGEKVGIECIAFVLVSLDHSDARIPFLERIHLLEEVQECHHIAGEDDYLLKVRCRNTKDLDRIISYEIKNVNGVVRTRTTIVLDTMKETVNIPLSEDWFK